MNKKIILALLVCCVVHKTVWSAQGQRAWPQDPVHEQRGREVVRQPAVLGEEEEVFKGRLWEMAGERQEERLRAPVEIIFDQRWAALGVEAFRGELGRYIGRGKIRATIESSRIDILVLAEVLGPQLNSVHFSPKVGDIYGGILRDLPNTLRELELPYRGGEYSFTEDHLLHFEQLEHLSLPASISPVDYRRLFGEWQRTGVVRSLQYLDIALGEHATFDTRDLTPFTNLRTVILKDVPEANINPNISIQVDDLPTGLTHVGLLRCNGIKGDSFDRFPNLNTLEIDLKCFRDQDRPLTVMPSQKLMDSIARIRNLQRLALNRLPDEMAVRVLTTIPGAVTHLEFTSSDVFPLPEAVAARLRSLRLESLNVENTSFGRASFELLPLTLRRVSFNDCRNLSGFFDFSRWRNLEAIDFTGTDIDRRTLFSLPRHIVDVVVASNNNLTLQDIFTFQKERAVHGTTVHDGYAETPFEVFPQR